MLVSSGELRTGAIWMDIPSLKVGGGGDFSCHDEMRWYETLEMIKMKRQGLSIYEEEPARRRRKIKKLAYVGGAGAERREFCITYSR